MTTPYEAPDNIHVGDYVVNTSAPNPAYRVQEHADHDYMDSPIGAWSPTIRAGADSIPDAGRLGTIRNRTYRPAPGAPPERFWDAPGGPGYDENQRHRSGEFVDSDGWKVFRGDSTRKRSAPDPRRTPPPEVRRTSDLSPTTYSFLREYDQHSARRFNGNHFSMADHRRTYDVYGMAPVYSRRNTYRADPQPWDTDIVDYAPTYDPVYARQVSIPDSAGRAWRLS